MNFAIIPVKDFTRAKERLSPLLSRPERTELALAMYEDVLEAVTNAQGLDRVVVISNDRIALQLAKQRGAASFEEADQRGQSRSVKAATEYCIQMGATKILSLPLDIPLVNSTDIDSILNASNQSPYVVMVPSRNGDGTNALLRDPPDIMKCNFGIGSFKAHLGTLLQKHIPHQVLQIANIALDIDTVDDLAILVSQICRTRAQRLLLTMGIDEKIHAYQRL